MTSITVYESVVGSVLVPHVVTIVVATADAIAFVFVFVVAILCVLLSIGTTWGQFG